MFIYDFFSRRSASTDKEDNSHTSEQDDAPTPKKLKKQEAWSDKDTNTGGPEQKIIYTYEECAFIMDRLNFVFFFFITSLLTIVLFVTITAGP